MKNSNIYYEMFLKETERRIFPLTYIWDDIEKVEKRLKSIDHDSIFYFHCGMACECVRRNIQDEKRITVSFIEGLIMFEEFIGLEE